jgi:hypothetical protein
VTRGIKKGGGNIAIATRQSSVSAARGGAIALRDEIHCDNSRPARFASFATFSIRQAGMPPFAVFQLDTVVGDNPSARATFTVPPSASIMSVGVCINTDLRYS